MKKKTYYYHDPVHDDFASTDIKQIRLPDNYRYVTVSLPGRVLETVLRWVLFPLLYLILKLIYLQRIRNRKVLKAAGKQGYFLFGNHTDYMLDAYDPTILSFPRKAHIIVNADAVSIKGLSKFVRLLGAVPVPTSLSGYKNFLQGIDELVRRNRVIAIYPEAHIWPYYTDIRPFGTESFHYAADAGLPCFTFTNIYCRRKLKLIRLPKVITYVDGPFRPDMGLPRRERIRKLRDEIYGAMKARVDGNPKYDYCDYVYVEDESRSNRKGICTDAE